MKWGMNERAGRFYRRESGVSMCRVDGSFQEVNDFALDRDRIADNTRAGRGGMAATAEQGGDIVYIHFFAFGTKADAGQLRFDFFKHTSHHDGFDGADVIDQALGVVRAGAGASEVGFLQPEISDLVV